MTRYSLSVSLESPTRGGIGLDLSEKLFPVGQWIYIAVVVDEKALQLIVNGKRWGMAQSGMPIFADSNSPLYIGGVDFLGSSFGIAFTDGLIDEIRISDKVRYPGREGDWIDNVNVPDEAFDPDRHTLALWHFDGVGRERLRDASGNGHHLSYSAYSIDPIKKLTGLWGEIKRR